MGSRPNSIVVVMMVVVMVVTVAMRHHDNHRAAPMAVMMVVVMMMELRELNVVRRQRRFAFIDRLQLRLGVRDRLQQIGERIRLQNVDRRRCRRCLSSIQGPERRHRSQKSSNLLVHMSPPKGLKPRNATRTPRDGSARA
jgi:uncharacterized paraquat-inducible protein A